jgi:hypothetical protein
MMTERSSHDARPCQVLRTHIIRAGIDAVEYD